MKVCEWEKLEVIFLSSAKNKTIHIFNILNPKIEHDGKVASWLHSHVKSLYFVVDFRVLVA